MLTKLGGACPNAGTEAEFGVGNEAGPLMILQAVAESIAVNETTNRISVSVSAVGIKFTTGISLRYVDRSEVANTSYLNIVRGFDKVNAVERAVWNEPCTTSRLGAPSDLKSFGITNGSDSWGRPQTEVIDIIDPSGLTMRRLRASSAAVVDALLVCLRRGRESRCQISNVPDLVCASTTACRGLDLSSAGGAASSEVNALALVQPGELIMVENIIRELLIGIVAVASGDLELNPIGSTASRYDKTFVGKDANEVVGKEPLLCSRSCAICKNNGCSISRGTVLGLDTFCG